MFGTIGSKRLDRCKICVFYAGNGGQPSIAMAVLSEYRDQTQLNYEAMVCNKFGGFIIKIKMLALLAALSAVVLICLSPVDSWADRGRPGWGHGDIRNFPRDDDHIWRGGRWYHGGYGGRIGWWWIVAGTWYFYPGPVYPYPNPYVPPIVVNSYPAIPAAPGPAPMDYWYYCRAAKGYYPYVPTCPSGWEKVPATPPPPATPPG